MRYKEQKREMLKEMVQLIYGQLAAPFLRSVNQARDKGTSLWMPVLPLKEQGFDLNKAEFRDALHLGYKMSLTMLPTSCPCGQLFKVEHALTCRTGGYVSMRHDTIQDTCAVLLDKVCHDVGVGPHLIPIDGEYIYLGTANTSNEAGLDIKAKGFWRSGKTAFFKVRVMNMNSASNQNLQTKEIFTKNENGKKW